MPIRTRQPGQRSMFAVGIDRRASGHPNHLVDAAARRTHLHSEFAVGGTGVQAEAAVNALIEVELRGSQIGLLRYDGKVGHGLEGCLGRTVA